MAVRPSRLMKERVKEMLIRDKMGVGEGFSAALTGDLSRVLGDYFDILSEPVVAVGRNEDGEYEVKVSVLASSVKRFETTAPPPEC